MKTKLPVSGIMTRRMASVQPEDNLECVRQIFERHGFHHIPVVRSGKLSGIVSYTDYLRIIHEYFSNLESKPASEKLLQTLTVEDMMTENPVCLKPEDTVETALRVFRENQFHALPVTDVQGKLLGILTTYDVMKVFEDTMAPEHSYSE
ncbi:MAG: CBS domain-containing protein [Saprospiraceae bacterium]|nr:CBS domain-containing protein [Saprospiraceae bacterium]